MMPVYNLYRITPDGHVAGMPEIFLAESDAKALDFPNSVSIGMSLATSGR